MNANIAKVQSLIENAFTSAIEKLAKDESGNFISDFICAGRCGKRGTANL